MARSVFRVLLLFVSVLVPFAARTATGPVAGGYHIDSAANATITAHSVTKKVTNNHLSGLTIYVPLNTSTEWAAYVANPPPGVLIENAAAPVNVTISTSQNNVNLYTLAGSPGTAGTFNFTINAGVTIGSSSAATPSVVTGAFPVGSTVNIINNGNIYGRGGGGGAGFYPGAAGQSGGSAISLSIAISITNNGNIFGGGGGGGGGGESCSSSCVGGGGGGGGRGFATSAGGAAGLSDGYGGAGTGGSTTAAGGGYAAGLAGGGGNGGDWGTAGQAGIAGNSTSGYSGGAAGKSVQLNGYSVNWVSGNNGTQVKGPVL